MEAAKMIIPFVSSLVITALLMPLFIGMMVTHKEGQKIRAEGPKWQAYKSGTPTMGGAVFLVAIVVTNIWVGSWMKLYTTSLFLMSLMFLLFGAIGFLDDFIKLYKHRNLGLLAWQKSSLQVVFGLLFAFLYIHNGFPTDIQFFQLYIHSTIVFVLFALFWIVGFSNAVNLTDGLDGLATGLSFIAYCAYAYMAWVQKNYDLVLVCLSVAGGLLAFLFFNHKPAKIFMGDVGSLALGAGLATVSILLGNPWSLLWIGIVFVVETLSVIIQVTVFKTTGHRVFKMTPIHHHFEMCGWSEWKIVIVFWLVGLIAAGSYILIFY